MKFIKLEFNTKFFPNDVAVIYLNRPEVRNAFNPEMILELTSAFDKISESESVKMLHLTSSSTTFCSGADLNWMQSMSSYDYMKNLEDSEKLNQMFLSLYKLPIPVLVSVKGYAMGGALGLIACGDIVIATEGTEFAFSEVRIGLAPAVISPYVLQKIGYSNATRFLTSGESFSANRAKEMALIHEVVTESNYDKKNEEIISHILKMAPSATRATKKLLREISPLKMNKDIFDLTTDLIARLRVGDEGQEGIKSFLNKKLPAWRTS